MLVRQKIQGTRLNSLRITGIFLPVMFVILLMAGCGAYKFTGASIPPDVKTVRVQYIENTARYKNPQLSPQLTDKLRQKIVSQTKLTQVNSDDADFDISGAITQYDVSTSGISNQQVSTNRLTVGVSLVLRNRKKLVEYLVRKITDNFIIQLPFSLCQS